MKVFDLHCDTLYECYETGKSLRQNTFCIDRQKVAAYAMYAQVFALFCGVAESKLHTLPPEKRLDALLDTAKQQFQENADWLMLCKNLEDFEWAKTHKKAMGFLSIEGAELISSLEQLPKLYDAGVRMVTLTWNHRNAYADGVMEKDASGLTSLGKQLVQKMVQLGMILDVSHLSEPAFWEVCVETEAPFVASHSNCQSICGHLRNLSDLQLLEIFRRGGLVGINLYDCFLTEENTPASITDILRHIDHILALGGEDCLALGADWDGCDKMPFESIADLEQLANAMQKQNYLQSTIDRLFFENADRFFSRMLHVV